MSNTRTDFYTWHAKPADGRGRTRRLNKGHTTGRGSTPVVVAEWRGTTSLGPIPAVLTKNICCPARHMRITLVVPCVNYRYDAQSIYLNKQQRKYGLSIYERAIYYTIIYT